MLLLFSGKHLLWASLVLLALGASSCGGSEKDSEADREAIVLEGSDTSNTTPLQDLQPADSARVVNQLEQQQPIFVPASPVRDTFDTLLEPKDDGFRLKTEYYTSNSEGLKYGVRDPAGNLQLYVFLDYEGRVQLLRGEEVLTDQRFSIADFAPYTNNDFQQQGLIAAWDFYGYQPETESIAIRTRLIIPQSERYYDFLVAVYANHEVEFIKLGTNEEV